MSNSADSIASMTLPSGDELLMRVARTTLTAGEEEYLREICSRQIDWPRVVDAAHRHGVASLLYRALSRVAPDLVPAETLERLAVGFASTVRFNLHLTGQLFEILELLQAEGIPALPYKGPVLASLVYGTLSLRQFGDIDLLVPSDRVWQVDVLLVGRGYRREGGQGGGPLPSEGQFLYEQEKGGAVIEVHWELAQSFYAFPFTFEQLWERRMNLNVGGRNIPTFGFEDTVLTMALHHTKHRWERVIWIADVAELVRSRPDERWIEIIEKGRKIGAERALLLGLQLAKIVCGAHLPAEVVSRIDRDREIDPLALQVIDELVGGAGRLSPIGDRAAFNVQARERLSDRLRFVWRRALVPTLSDRSAVRLPASADRLYYLIRPFRLLLQWLKSIRRSRS